MSGFFARSAVLLAVFSSLAPADSLSDRPGSPDVTVESPSAAAARHRRVAKRRAGVQIICHRGALELAHENTLEAYRAAFDLGADGNEIDIRATEDGVLVCFHDDMIDHLLEAYGDVSDHKWEELRRFRFRDPGPFGKHSRIPTLAEVLELHRDYAGLLHLDVKRAELADPVMRMLERMDMWDHVVQAPVAVDDPRVKRGRYKASLYADRGEVDAQAIEAALQKPGDSIILEDPRGVAAALGRDVRRPSPEPVAPVEVTLPDRPSPRTAAELLDVLRDADDWSRVAVGDVDEVISAERILRRARAADELARLDVRSKEALVILEQRVRQRSLHRSWRYCGLDGAAALRALVRLDPQRALRLARFCLWRDDPTLKSVVHPQGKGYPLAWTDWRTKGSVFRELEKIAGDGTARLCRDYLDLTDEDARRIGSPQFEAAARALLVSSPREGTATELMSHRRGDVRGRAILFCLANVERPWARRALESNAPHALEYVLPPAERRESFDRDPGWEGRNNRSPAGSPRRVHQDFGFSETRHAGGSSDGEIGGFITPAAEPAYYAKKIPERTFSDRLRASGTLACTGRQFHLLIGFFNSRTLSEWRTPNTIALRVYGRGDEFYVFVEYATQRWRAGGDNPRPFATIDPETGKRQQIGFQSRGVVHRWTLDYDPAGAGGRGSVTVTIDGKAAVCHLDPGHKADGAAFDRFGILTVMKSVDSGGEIWVDDVTVEGERENFSTDPRWDEFQNRRDYSTRDVRPLFDFGFSATRHAGGKQRGELGGLVFRGDHRYADRMAFYADRVGELTMLRALRASGKIALRRGVSDSTTLLGFFHSRDSMVVGRAQKSGVPKSFVGIAIEGPSREGFFVYPAYRLRGGESVSANGDDRPRILPDGKSYDFRLAYSPGSAGRRGTILVRLGEQETRLKLGEGQGIDGTRFDRFGIVTTWIDGNGQRVFFDDLSYTSEH